MNVSPEREEFAIVAGGPGAEQDPRAKRAGRRAPSGPFAWFGVG